MTAAPVLDQYYPGGPLKQIADFAASVPKNPTTERTKIAFVGDSITRATINSNAGNDVFNCNRGASFWVPFQTGRSLVSPQSLNFGVSGDTTAMVLARMGPILASGAGYFHVMIGVNDSGDLSQTLTNLTSIWTQLLETGAVVIASTVLPRTALAQATRDYVCSMNSYIRAQAGRYDNFYVVDPALAYGDPTASDFGPRTNYSYDGIHPRGLGGFYMSQPLVRLIQAIVPPTVPAFGQSLDVWSGTNRSGSLMTNSILTGTAGTKTAAGATLTGNVADSWAAVVVPNGGTVTNLIATASKVTLADGRPAQRLIMSGDVTLAGSGAIDNGTLIQLTQDAATPSNIISGDVLRGECDVAVAAGTAGLAALDLALFVTVSGTTYSVRDGAGFTADLLPSDAFSGVLRTPDFTVPAGTVTLARLQVRLLFTDGTAVTVAFDGTVAGLALRKV